MVFSSLQYLLDSALLDYVSNLKKQGELPETSSMTCPTFRWDSFGHSEGQLSLNVKNARRKSRNGFPGLTAPGRATKVVNRMHAEGGRTLRKSVFLPSKRLLSAFYDTPPF